MPYMSPRSSTMNRTDEESHPLIHKGEEDDEGVKLFQRILMAALSIMAVAMIAIGHIYLFDCNVQPYIPIFLLVGGYSSILKCQLSLVMGCCWKNNTACKIVNYWSYLMLLFMMVWFIVGSVWVYGVKKVDFEDTTSTAYCNKTLYYFSWWLLIIYWSLICVLILFSILCCFFVASCIKTTANNPDPEVAKMLLPLFLIAALSGALNERSVK